MTTNEERERFEKWAAESVGHKLERLGPVYRDYMTDLAWQLVHGNR